MRYGTQSTSRFDRSVRGVLCAVDVRASHLRSSMRDLMRVLPDDSWSDLPLSLSLSVPLKGLCRGFPFPLGLSLDVFLADVCVFLATSYFMGSWGSTNRASRFDLCKGMHEGLGALDTAGHLIANAVHYVTESCCLEIVASRT